MADLGAVILNKLGSLGEGGAAKVPVIDRGIYSRAATYSVNDIVRHPVTGQTYRAIQEGAANVHGTAAGLPTRVGTWVYDTNTTSASTPSITVPAGAVAAGDLLMLFISSANANPGGITGWTSVTTSTNVFNEQNYSNQYYHVYRRTATAGDASSGLTATGPNSNTYESARIVAWRGVDIKRSFASVENFVNLAANSTYTGTTHTWAFSGVGRYADPVGFKSGTEVLVGIGINGSTNYTLTMGGTPTPTRTLGAGTVSYRYSAVWEWDYAQLPATWSTATTAHSVATYTGQGYRFVLYSATQEEPLPAYFEAIDWDSLLPTPSLLAEPYSEGRAYGFGQSMLLSGRYFQATRPVPAYEGLAVAPPILVSQVSAKTGSSALSLSVTVTDLQPDDLILVFGHYNSNSTVNGSSTAVSDDKGGAWRVVTYNGNFGNGVQLDYRYATQTDGSTIVITSGTTSYAALMVKVYRNAYFDPTESYQVYHSTGTTRLAPDAANAKEQSSIIRREVTFISSYSTSIYAWTFKDPVWGNQIENYNRVGNFLDGTNDSRFVGASFDRVFTGGGWHNYTHSASNSGLVSLTTSVNVYGTEKRGSSDYWHEVPLLSSLANIVP